METQKRIMKELNVQPIIDEKREIRKRIEFLKEYLLKSGLNGYVLGISGGQDSTLAGKLAQLAVTELANENPEKEYEFVALRLPFGEQKDEKDAKDALEYINPSHSYTFNIKTTVEDFSSDYLGSSLEPLSDFNKGNVKARLRMITQYAFAGQRNLLVIGTDHAAEAITGFFTKYGDGGADILPLSGLTKRQGRNLLIELKAPESLYLKTPTADLLDHKPLQSDETELGISYEQLDDYLEGQKVAKEIAEKIENRYFSTQHKRQLPTSLSDVWWK
ncbi:ammonia-dependent NAD(+) synthetase [[Brevibacterium] frigoritolerans]|nr:ammonia-dependent NAD(+) synthetase [Peribacillus frigoritolerans]